MEKSKPTKLHCVLVHGTFANDATWVDSNSPLAKSLLCLEPDSVRLSNFRWLGDNTHTARVQASKDLSDYLEAEVCKSPECRILLVGHSHGGNIILRAADVIPEALRAGAVCLASPFFHVRMRSTFAIFWMITGSWIAAIATILNFGMSGFTRLVEYLQFTWLGKLIDWFPSFPVALHSIGRFTSSLGGATMAVILVVVVCICVGLAVSGKQYRGQQVARNRWEVMLPTRIRTLCIWLTPDEAFWGLTIARTIAEFAHHAVFVSTRYVLPAVAFLAVASGFWYGWSYGMEGTAVSAETRAISAAMPALQIGGLLMVVIPFMLISFALLLSVLRMPTTGTYYFSDFAWLDIQTQRLPQIEPKLVRSCPLPLNDGGFFDNLKVSIPMLTGPIFHSRLYSDDRAFAVIQNWYAEHKRAS